MYLLKPRQQARTPSFVSVSVLFFTSSTSTTTSTTTTVSVWPALKSEMPSETQHKPPSSSILATTQIIFRALAAACTVVAISIMVSNVQNVTVFGFRFTARFNYSSSMRFLFGTDVVVCSFSVLSLIATCIMNRSKSDPQKTFLLFLHDLVMMLLMISGCAAATAVGYVSKYGEEKMGWSPVCVRVSKFCSKMSVALAFSYLAFFCYFGLVLLSSKKIVPGVVAVA